MQIQDYIGLISLVLAISALFLQMRSNGRQLRLQNFTEYTKRYQEIMLKLPGNITSEMFDIESLSTERREILLRYLRAYFDLCSEEYLGFPVVPEEYMMKSGLLNGTWRNGISPGA